MQTIDRDRDRKSLQDLAKMAQGMTPPPSSVAAFSPVPSTRSVTNLPNDKKDDSGIVDLAAASAADPGAAMRAQSTPLANHSLFEDVPPPPPVNAPPPSYVPPSGPMQAYQPAPSVPPPAYASVHPIGPALSANGHVKKKGGAGLVFALTGVLAIGAAAAGGFLFIRSHKAAPAPVAATTVAVAQPAAAPLATVDSPKAEAPAIVAENKPSESATDLSSLPNASAKTAKVATRSGAAKPAAVAKADPTDKAAAEDDAKAKADKAKLDKALAGNDTPAAAPPAPAGQPGDLGAAMNAASGGGKMADQQPKPAAGSSGSAGNIPQKPSQGAVTGALGAVLPAARECLGPDDPISRASVIFNSDGSVAGVSVSGAAAGKPAAACIEKELRKAKLQPFAEPTYTANITIRHN